MQIKERDIVELLTEALQNKETPDQPICPQFDNKRHHYIGRMPYHLRKLYVLKRKISEDRNHPGSYHIEMMLQDSLEQHYPTISESTFSEIRIYSDWIVGGTAHAKIALGSICGLAGIADMRPTEFCF